jgi:hypothetical protein
MINLLDTLHGNYSIDLSLLAQSYYDDNQLSWFDIDYDNICMSLTGFGTVAIINTAMFVTSLALFYASYRTITADSSTMIQKQISGHNDYYYGGSSTSRQQSRFFVF